MKQRQGVTMIIRPKRSIASGELWKYYTGQKKVFTRLAITPPKVNRCWWNLEQCEDIVGGWPWHILGTIRAVATAWQAAEILLFFFGQVNNARFHRFPVGKIVRYLNTTTLIGEAVKNFRNRILKNFTVRSRFSKRQNCSQNFQVLRLQVAMTPQWLQIARNSLQTDHLLDV